MTLENCNHLLHDVIEALEHYEEVCREEKFYDYGLGAREMLSRLHAFVDEVPDDLDLIVQNLKENGNYRLVEELADAATLFGNAAKERGK